MNFYIKRLLLLLLGVVVQLSVSAQVTINAPSGNGESNYQWYDASSGSEVAIGGANSASYATSTPGVYLATYDNSGCGGASEYFVLKEDCTDPTVTLNMGAVNGGTTNQWYEDLASPTAIGGETAVSMVVTATTTATTYFMRATTGDCVNDLPAFTVLNLSECCIAGTVDYAITDGTYNTTGYQWDNSSTPAADVPSTLQYGLHRSTEYCVDGSWRHYYNTNEPNTFLFSVEMGSNTTEIDYIDIRVEQTPSARHNYSNTNGMYGMERDWHVETVGGAALTAPVSIRFYYPPDEFKDMLDAAIAQSNVDPTSTAPTAADVVWFKKETYNPATDIEPTGGTLAGGTAYQALTPVMGAGANGVASTDTTTLGNNANYVQFDGISNFSGGSAFVLIFGTALPVELSKFEARPNGCAVNLYWKTESEENFSHYEVQRSENGVDFETIEKVEGEGGITSVDYEYLDRSAEEFNYYRLKMVDLDGSVKYSSVVYAESNCAGEEGLAIYPNPTSRDNGTLNIKFYSGREEARINILDMLGRRVKTISLDVEKEWNTITVDISDLPAGTYNIQMAGKERSQKLIIHD